MNACICYEFASDYLCFYHIGTLLVFGILDPIIGEGKAFSNHFWILLLLFTGIIAVASFAIYVFSTYRSFEIREMDSMINSISTGKKHPNV
ncbi:hypothetical protein PB01_11195 [Psychrobacillus glaciei]|uniref:Uncharacterized protein n=1 Tax=Psychrobacillus glaciei TaxID=2283160 RepID=A0A5J6SN14_9BACI|nr:hypothetical protein [Psychrobacillus glaciei]QFF99345.1 hypothetical protein PB01_11195 [Psychrobacillus glaciei]